MTFTRKLIAAAVISAASMSSSAFAADPALSSILNSIETGTWSQVSSFDDLLDASWNKAGTKLSFTLVSENTSWAPYQTFSILDGSNLDLIFQGADTENATKSYTLTEVLYDYFFSETNPNANFSRNKAEVFKSQSGIYAFAHEDWKDNDYNDMVVSMKVSAVPEPETYAMMLAGLGFVGFVARKKKAV